MTTKINKTDITDTLDSQGQPVEPDEFVVYHSQAKVAGFAALYLLGVLGMPYMFFFEALPRHNGRVVWAAAITFCFFLIFGYVFLIAARALLAARSPNPRPALVISERGFLDQSSLFGGKGWVFWEEVAGVSVEPTGRFLQITLRDEEAYLKYIKRHPRFEKLNTWLRRLSSERPPLALMGTFLPLSLPEVSAQMLRYQAWHAANQENRENQNPERKAVDFVP